MAGIGPQGAPVSMQGRGREMTVYSQDSGEAAGGKGLRVGWGEVGGLRTELEKKASPVQRASLTKVSSEQVAIGGSIYIHGSPHGPPHVHTGSSSYENGFPAGDHELFTTFSWDDQKVRRVFIRKVTTSSQLSRTGGLGGGQGVP